MTDAVLRPLSLGEVLDLGFALYRKHFPALLTIAVVTRILPLAFNAYLAASGQTFSNLVMSLIGLVLSIVLGAIGIGASNFVISDAYLGETANANAAFHRALPYLGRLIATSMLTGLAASFGFLLLIIPGIIVVCGLAVSTPALILENLPSASAALGRSWELTKGYRGKIFGALFVAGLILYLPVLAIGGLISPETFAESTFSGLYLLAALPALLQVLIYPFFYAVFTILYYDLRVRKEGFDLEMLAAALQKS